MFLTDKLAVTAAASTPNACTIGLYPNSTDNPRSLPISGTRNLATCPTITIQVTYYDSNGAQVGPVEGPNPPTSTDGEFWDYTVNAPAGAASCKVEVFCGGVLQETVPNVGFAATVFTAPPPAPTPAPAPVRVPVLTATKATVIGGTNLVVTINNPNADKDDDSDVLVIQHHTSHGKYFAYPHSFKENPGKGTREITYHCMAPGRYTTKLVFIHGTKPVEIHGAPPVKIP